MAERAITPEHLEEKRAREERTVMQMIGIYCRGNHKRAQERKSYPHAGDLCPECFELAQYVHERIERCPRMEEKTFCSSCPVHCYAPAMRDRVREVMRYAGPRMLLHHPVAAVHHALDTAAAKRRAR